MSGDIIYAKIKKILEDNDSLNTFANLNRLTPDITKEMLDRLLQTPEIDSKVKEYLDSNDRSDDFKAYKAGEEIGYKKGEDAGFAKGVAVGTVSIITTLTLAGVAFLLQRR